MYTTFATLKDYGIWYYLRYYPSKQKFKNKLLEKSLQDKPLVQAVILDLEYIFKEEEIIEAKINHYLYKSKNLRYITQKLYEKLFDKTLIKKHLNKITAANKTLLNESFLKRKISELIMKNKSLIYIKQKLIEREQDREIVEMILSEISPFGDIPQLKKEIKKISNKYNLKNQIEKNKIIKKLLSKGFFYSDIKNLI